VDEFRTTKIHYRDAKGHEKKWKKRREAGCGEGLAVVLFHHQRRKQVREP
jgi:hypothetical protein